MEILIGVLATLVIAFIFWILKPKKQHELGKMLENVMIRIIRKKKYLELTNKLQRCDTELTEAKDELEQIRLNPTICKDPTFRRFDDIKFIKYGSIIYPPLYYLDQQNQPAGIGVSILKHIFKGKKLDRHHEYIEWGEIKDYLYDVNHSLRSNGSKFKVDIIATPLFETNSRTREYCFSSPLFYSEVGLYIFRDNPHFKNISYPLEFNTAINMINSKKGDIKATVIIGELSHILAKKHFEGRIIEKSRKNLNVAGLISTLIDEEYPSDIVFTETIQAEHTKEFEDGKVVNIFAPKTLLYPVGYVFRKECYILRNYINLKLHEIEAQIQNGINEIIMNELEKTGKYYGPNMTDKSKLEFVKKYFIRQYDDELMPAS